ncbi:hypothetical protein BKA93DRAFT_880294 [Sparassis latifolia]
MMAHDREEYGYGLTGGSLADMRQKEGPRRRWAQARKAGSWWRAGNSYRLTPGVGRADVARSVASHLRTSWSFDIEDIGRCNLKSLKRCARMASDAGAVLGRVSWTEIVPLHGDASYRQRELNAPSKHMYLDSIDISSYMLYEYFSRISNNSSLSLTGGKSGCSALEQCLNIQGTDYVFGHVTCSEHGKEHLICLTQCFIGEHAGDMLHVPFWNI